MYFQWYDSPMKLTKNTHEQKYAHREIFSESYKIKPKSDCINHFSIDLEPNRRIHLVPNQSYDGEYYLILVLSTEISKKIICEYVRYTDSTTNIYHT